MPPSPQFWGKIEENFLVSIIGEIPTDKRIGNKKSKNKISGTCSNDL